jgi:hypothetical protein
MSGDDSFLDTCSFANCLASKYPGKTRHPLDRNGYYAHQHTIGNTNIHFPLTFEPHPTQIKDSATRPKSQNKAPPTNNLSQVIHSKHIVSFQPALYSPCSSFSFFFGFGAAFRHDGGPPAVSLLASASSGLEIPTSRKIFPRARTTGCIDSLLLFSLCQFSWSPASRVHNIVRLSYQYDVLKPSFPSQQSHACRPGRAFHPLFHLDPVSLGKGPDSASHP